MKPLYAPDNVEHRYTFLLHSHTKTIKHVAISALIKVFTFTLGHVHRGRWQRIFKYLEHPECDANPRPQN